MVSLVRSKKAPTTPRDQLLPLSALRISGSGGPQTAAWLLGEHGPTPPSASLPRTSRTVRQVLHKSWRQAFKADRTGEEIKAFVWQRLEQVPDAAEESTLDAQAEVVLQALLREDATDQNLPGIATEGHPVGQLPYQFLPTDWARLSQACGVDFVVHGLPGTQGHFCSHCACEGHVHMGPREPGLDLALHVGFRKVGPDGRPLKGNCSSYVDSPEPEEERSPTNSRMCLVTAGVWEPLGTGQAATKTPPHEVVLDMAHDVSDSMAEAFGRMRVFSTPEHDEAETMLPSRWSMKNFSCVNTSACTCNSAGCPPEDQCPPRKGCHICPLRVERPNSEDLSIKAGLGTPFASAPPVPTSGARFCVLVQGEKLYAQACRSKAVETPSNSDRGSGLGSSTSSSCSKPSADDSGELARFREAFAAGVAAAAHIAPSRVRVLDIGPPVETEFAPWRRPRQRCETKAQHSVDTGAGVLSFLLQEDEPEIEKEKAVTSSPGVTRILAIIRESVVPVNFFRSPAGGSCSEEPNALRALDLVISELADPKSAFQETLRPWAEGGEVRLWCADAEHGARRPRPSAWQGHRILRRSQTLSALRPNSK